MAWNSSVNSRSVISMKILHSFIDILQQCFLATLRSMNCNFQNSPASHIKVEKHCLEHGRKELPINCNFHGSGEKKEQNKWQFTKPIKKLHITSSALILWFFLFSLWLSKYIVQFSFSS